MATAISFLNNFPVKFENESDSCLECDGRDFCQLAQWDDRFEFAFEPSTTDITVTNGTFTGGLTGWTNAGGDPWTAVSNKARATTTADSISQAISKIVGRKYKITFTISNYSGTGGLDVQFGDALYSAQNSSGANANGTYVIYLTPINSTDLFFTPVATFTLDLDDVTVELVTTGYTLSIINTETGVGSITTLTPNLSNSSISTLGFSYLWSEFNVSADGCYTFVLHPPTNFVTNGTFTGNANGWTFTTVAWVYGTNDLKLVGGASASTAYSNFIGLAEGKTYTITFDVTGYSGELSPTYGLRNTTGQFIFDPSHTITGNGSYSFAITVPDNVSAGTYAVAFRNVGTAASTNALHIDNVVMTESATASECYKLATTHECTKMLKWTNEDTNGFNYPYYYFYSAANFYGFQWMRVESDLRRAKYPGEAEKYIDSGGNNILYLGSVRKLKDFIVAMVPEYMHDALAVGFKHKAFYIDGVRYTLQDTDYTAEWASNIPTILAESTSLVGKYNQDNNSID